MADLPFVDFAFPATGALTPRTMPDRLAEVKNVMDFGATNDNTLHYLNERYASLAAAQVDYPHATNIATQSIDWAAIQGAVNWTSGANRGTIYFPAGLGYLTTEPVTFNYDGDLSICFRGEIGSTVVGNFADYVFSRKLATPNNTIGGRIFERLKIFNTHPSGGCIRLGSTKGGVIRECGFSGHFGITTEDDVGESSENINIHNVEFAQRDDTDTGSCHIVIGGGGVIHTSAILGSHVGVRAYGSGLHVYGTRQERNNTAFKLGVDSADSPVGLSGFSITSSTNEGNWTSYHLAGPCDGFFIGGHLIFGHDPENSGAGWSVGDPGPHGTQYGIRIDADCATNGVISGCNISSWMEIAGFSIANATSRTNLLITCCTSVETGGGGDYWDLPTNAYTATFVNCNVQPTWTVSQLPTGSNVLEGDELNVSDGTNGLAWGATVTDTGTHTTHYFVRHNGTNWTVVGK